MSVRGWIQASRPLAQVNIAMPLLLGQALAWTVHGSFDWILFTLVHLFGVLDQLVILYSNDLADEAADRDNDAPTHFSGGSRVLVDGILSRGSLTFGAGAAAVAVVGLAVTFAVVFDRPLMLPLTGAGAALVWAYGFPPVRLAYRGHGEILQGLGLGVVLPLCAFYVQAGTLAGFPWPALIPLFGLGYIGNFVTALPDSPADARATKRSPPVRLGQRRARKLILQLLAIITLLSPLVLPDASRATLLAVEIPPLLALAFAFRLLDRADAENRRACVAFVMTTAIAINLALAGWGLAAIL